MNCNNGPYFFQIFDDLTKFASTNDNLPGYTQNFPRLLLLLKLLLLKKP